MVGLELVKSIKKLQDSSLQYDINSRPWSVTPNCSLLRLPGLTVKACTCHNNFKEFIIIDGN